MTRLKLYILSFGLVATTAFSQTYKIPSDTVNKKSITPNSIGFLEYTLIKNRFYGLTRDNKIYSWSLTGDSVHIINHAWKTKISAIDKDNSNNLLVGLEDGKLYQAKKNSWVLISDIKTAPIKFLSTSENRLFVVTDRGIIEPKTCKAFFPVNSNNHQIPFDTEKKTMMAPTSYFIDSKNIIWLGFARGEWGGDIQAFNTKTLQFEKFDCSKLKLTLSPITSIFENDNGHIFVTSGMRHMGETGFIAVIDNFNVIKKHAIPSGKRGSHYIGQGSFNKFEKVAYFYDDNGWSKQQGPDTTMNFTFFLKRPHVPQDFSSVETDYDIKIDNYDFIDKDKIVFISNFGIGYLDNLKLTLYK